MRLPRIRFTVGTLLLSVAVVAVNCWAFRHLTETHTDVCGSISYRLLPASVGAVPLVNAALIGTWLLATRRLRLLHHGHAVGPPSSVSRATYFILHFLVLGGLVSLCMPDTVRAIQDVVEDATGCAAEGWGAVVGEPGGTVSWLIAESLILGVLISGPPLLLCWIGQALAQRCAATLPRHRFRAMTCLVSLGFASTGLAIALTPHPFTDELEIDLQFQVVDQVSGRPIPAAFVCITDPFSLDPTSSSPRALTDGEGRARLTGRFAANGHRNAFRIMGTFSPWGRWLEVSAADHRARPIPLTEVLGPFADPARPGHRKVALDRGPTPEDSFRDLAGRYSLCYAFSGSWFKIEPDGRFAWGARGCTSQSSEYGRLSRRDSDIVLIPIPHVGEETHPVVTLKYRVIEWGDRHYLAIADERVLRGFCRRALFPKRPSRFEERWIYPRESDLGKLQTGLPRVPPGVWVGFLLDELSLDNDTGSLRLALDRLFQTFAKRFADLVLGGGIRLITLMWV